MHLTGYQESLRYTTKIKSLSENKTEKQQIELNKGENECHDCFLLAQDHNISGRCCRIRARVILPVVSPTVTRAKQQITSSSGLSIYTKGIQSNLAIENCLNAHFICFMTDTQYVFNKNTRIINLFDWTVSLTYTVTLKWKSQKQNLIHMQVLKVDSEITVLYKIIITVFFFIIIKIHLLS